MPLVRRITFVADPGVHNIEALQRTLDIAKRTHSSITVAAIQPRTARGVSRSLASILLNVEARRRLEELEEAVAGISNQGVQIACELVSEASFLNISEHSSTDLFVVSHLGRGAPHSADYNRLAQRLARKCPEAVLVMKTSGPRTCSVLAAIAPDTPEETALNEHILDWAHAFSALEASTLHVVHTWIPIGASLLRSPRKSSPERLSEYVWSCRHEHERLLDEFLLTHGKAGIDYRVHLVQGNTAEVIPDLARRLRVGIVIVGTVARSGMARLLMGNTSEELVSRVQTSLLIVSAHSAAAHQHTA